MPPIPPRSRTGKDFPWWLAVITVAGVAAYAYILLDPDYARILRTLLQGAWVTIFVTLVAFVLAALLGMMLALAAGSRFGVLRHGARIYVEVIRGVPIIVLLLYVAFVLAPLLVAGVNALIAPLGLDPVRDLSLLWRAIIALVIAYSSFLAEVFRAGLQSVDKGQLEAADALGLSRWHRFRLVIFPQAFRTILPPLGNDFVSMVKDSSLVSVLGVIDITQLGKVTAASNFAYLETYNVVALVYLTFTLTLSLLLRRLEAHLRAKGQR
ncbi:amino acid ABC transporter permease [Thioclava sp. BHET1]|nr:amino acid ABC transporter permease [Thioclava sp. BHET1]